MVTKIAMTLMAALIVGVASLATIQAASAYPTLPPNEAAREAACNTGCGAGG